MKKKLLEAFIIIIITMFSLNLQLQVNAAAENALDNTDEVQQEEDDGKIKLDAKAVITVEMEEENRFLGISVYKIGEIEDEQFVYLPQYRELVECGYSAVPNKKILNNHIDTFADYIKENNIAADANIHVANGTGKTDELSVGLYLLIQNKDDFNSELSDVTLVEAPTYSEDTKEYLYDIRVYPKWEATVWFSFRPEVVYPLVIVLTLISCVLLCMYGMKIISYITYTTAFFAIGVVGMQLGMSVSDQYIWMMLFFLLSGFIGVAIAYVIVIIIGGLFRRVNIKGFFKNNSFWISTLLGGGVAGIVIYSYLSTNSVFYAVIPGVMAVTGGIVQYLRRDKEVAFYTYEDLLNLKPEEEN